MMIPANIPTIRIVMEAKEPRLLRNLSMVKLTPTNASIKDKAQMPNKLS